MKKLLLFLLIILGYGIIAQYTSLKKKCPKCGTTHILSGGSGPGIMNPNLYPNPATNYIVISTQNTNGCSVVVEVDFTAFEIFDQNGLSVLHEQFSPTNEHIVDISSLPIGTYYAHIELNTTELENNIIIEQFVKE